MQFIKVRDVKSPVRDVNENAGIDFYIPEVNEQFVNDFNAKNEERGSTINRFNGVIRVPAHCDVLIPSGIKSKFEPNLALIANNKSGVATKKKLVFGASVIDASYHGEWHLHLINTSNEEQTIECGTKVIQFIPHVISMDPVEVLDITEEKFYANTTSKRGDRGFGAGTGLN